MKTTTDLEAALSFVTSRIEEAALRSGDQLSDEQHHLLHHLPTSSPSPYDRSVSTIGDFVLAPRDFDFEKLCDATKSARAHDLRLNPTSATDWEFVAAVSKLNHHPISWLLEWAGVHVRRPWWDKWLLVAFALLFVLFTTCVMLLAMAWNASTRLQWLAIGAGYIAVVVAAYFVSRRIGEWQLKRTIETCRRASNFVQTRP
jgi:hypothetical protein